MHELTETVGFLSALLIHPSIGHTLEFELTTVGGSRDQPVQAS